jgi:hypothetical protein
MRKKTTERNVEPSTQHNTTPLEASLPSMSFHTPINDPINCIHHIHTHTHTYKHKHTHTHTFIHTFMHTYIHTYIYIHTRPGAPCIFSSVFFTITITIPIPISISISISIFQCQSSSQFQKFIIYLLYLSLCCFFLFFPPYLNFIIKFHLRESSLFVEN